MLAVMPGSPTKALDQLLRTVDGLRVANGYGQRDEASFEEAAKPNTLDWQRVKRQLIFNAS